MENKFMKTDAFYRPPKAYNNREFLHSADARTVRVLCEFLEPADRLRKFNINHTIVFFGSARTKPPEMAQAELKAAHAEMRRSKRPSKDARAAYERAKREVAMSRYYQDAMALAERLTAWTKSVHKPRERLVVCSGGGPGIMEAANRGAANAGGHSIGFNISLPFEQRLNPYQTKELAFEFHYFFIRKFWFVHLSKAMAVFPGGFGTLDEFIELLTLIQTGKTAEKVPIVLYGKSYWSEVLHFDAMVKWGVISREDLSLFRLCNDVDTAFDYLTTEIRKCETAAKDEEL